MRIHNNYKSRWLWVLTSTLLASLLGLHSAVAEDADGLRVTEYFISHASNEPNNLDPRVILHVREVVLPGRERTISLDGKVLLLIHGYSVPGYVAFDTDHEDCSLMRHLARVGWDTFALDLEGFGLSTRPLVMDNPAAFPDSKAPIHADVTLRDVERVVDFIRSRPSAARDRRIRQRSHARLDLRHRPTLAAADLCPMGGLPTAVAAGARVAYPASLTVVRQHSEYSLRSSGTAPVFWRQCSGLFVNVEICRRAWYNPG
jgi:hypothetical protein